MVLDKTVSRWSSLDSETLRKLQRERYEYYVTAGKRNEYRRSNSAETRLIAMAVHSRKLNRCMFPLSS